MMRAEYKIPEINVCRFQSTNITAASGLSAEEKLKSDGVFNGTTRSLTVEWDDVNDTLDFVL